MFHETLRSPATLFALAMAVGLLCAAGIMEADSHIVALGAGSAR